MWSLLFIVLIDVVGIDRVVFLEAYPTKDDCESERQRITVEMEKTYPGDKTWKLECRPNGHAT